MLDIGGYPIQLAQWVFDKPPKKIKASGDLNENGVDFTVEMDLIYDENGNQIAKLKATNLEEWKNEAVIIGTKGKITVSMIFNVF